MQALEFLDIRDNPLSLMSCMGSHFKSIINQGGYETLKFIKLQNEGSEEVFRMKLMFVGNGNAPLFLCVGSWRLLLTLWPHFDRQRGQDHPYGQFGEDDQGGEGPGHHVGHRRGRPAARQEDEPRHRRYPPPHIKHVTPQHKAPPGSH
jgi:hypothetical protein